MRILEMTQPGRAYASLRKSVIEPCGCAVSQIGAHRLMDWVNNLEEDENCADQRKRTREKGAVLHCADKHPHRYGESRRQHTS